MTEETGVSEINKAVVIMHEMSEDEKIREMARLREKWILDENSNREFFKRQGLEEGRAEGRAEGEANVISKLLKRGFSEEEIRDILNS